MGVPDIEKIRPKGLGVRHAQTFLLFLAMILAFCMRVNMSMAIVDMTNEENDTYFDWNYTVQSMILSSFFWGYIILQIPGGELAKRFGGKILITISVAVNALLSLAMPIGAKLGGWQFVIACRMLQGLTQAFVYPSMHHLVSQWIPLEEKGTLSTIIYAGGQLGIAIQLIASGFLATAWGWQAIFYVNGTLGAIWTIVYLMLGSASPESSKLISEEELRYIQTSLGRVGAQKKYPTPYRKIAGCLPFWAAVIAHCGQNWGFFTLMTEMPTYMAKVLGMNLTKNGILSSLPYLAMYILSFPMGTMTDLIIRRGWLSVTNTRKLFNTIGLWGPALALVGLSYTPEGNLVLAVVMLTVSVGINAGQYTGYMLISIDLAPNFSSSLMGISNFFANIISIIAPIVCGIIIKDETEASEWRKVFFLASAVYFFTNLFFILFTTSARQEWNEPNEETDVEFGRLSTVDYRTMFGHEVTAAGYGLMNTEEGTVGDTIKLNNSLQVFDAVIIKCNDNRLQNPVHPGFCLGGECDYPSTICPGDSGGPVIHPTGIIAVNSAGTNQRCRRKSFYVTISTPISPFLDWIANNIGTL